MKPARSMLIINTAKMSIIQVSIFYCFNLFGVCGVCRVRSKAEFRKRKIIRRIKACHDGYREKFRINCVQGDYSVDLKYRILSVGNNRFGGHIGLYLFPPWRILWFYLLCSVRGGLYLKDIQPLGVWDEMQFYDAAYFLDALLTTKMLKINGKNKYLIRHNTDRKIIPVKG